MPLVIPEHGQRAAIFGKSGSGKSMLARYVLYHLPGAVIYDTKGESAFDTMGPIVTDPLAIWDTLASDDAPEYVVFRPTPELMADPAALDAVLRLHYEVGHGTVAYIDEGYQWHRAGQAGPGLTGLLTRGRSKGITTIVGSQRPAWISRFVLTECNHFFVLRLGHDDDIERVASVVPGYDRHIKRRGKVPYFYWDYARDSKERIYRYPPIDIDYRPPQDDSGNETAEALPPADSYFSWL